MCWGAGGECWALIGHSGSFTPIPYSWGQVGVGIMICSLSGFTGWGRGFRRKGAGRWDAVTAEVVTLSSVQGVK